jgi:hypothetical protein
MKATEGRAKLQKAGPGRPVEVVKDEGVVPIKQELIETS